MPAWAIPFPTGKPTSYDTFGSIPGNLAPSPVPDEALPQNADGSLASAARPPAGADARPVRGERGSVRLITQEPLRTLAKSFGFIPYIDDPTATGQSRHGIIFRGRSYIDGNDAILMDWRGFQAAWPLGPGMMLGDQAGMLIYDGCGAVQTGVDHCTAVTDWKLGNRRHTWQEGYMPWVLKGPPSIEQSAHTRPPVSDASVSSTSPSNGSAERSSGARRLSTPTAVTAQLSPAERRYFHHATDLIEAQDPYRGAGRIRATNMCRPAGWRLDSTSSSTAISVPSRHSIGTTTVRPNNGLRPLLRWRVNPARCAWW